MRHSLLALLLAILTTSGCATLLDAVLTESESDCLEDEQYDWEDRLCYVVWDDSDAEYEDELLDEVFDFFEDLLGGWLGDLDGFDMEEEQVLVTYDVVGDALSNPVRELVPSELEGFQDDVDTQETLWSFFRRLVPNASRRDLAKFAVFTDGPDGTLGAIAQDEDQPTRWVLFADIQDAGDPDDLTYTMVHEFGHLLTLRQGQVDIDLELARYPDDEDLFESALEACPTFFPGEGCSRRDSYLNRFFEAFWLDIYPEWEEAEYIEDDYDYEDAITELYERYEDQFVSEYAASNPAEDIAETWAYFVLRPRPKGNSPSDRKIMFFYEQPELVSLRREMLGRSLSRLRRAPAE